jgi:hypothetical protein
MSESGGAAPQPQAPEALDIATLIAAGALVYTVSLVLHQGAHAWIGSLMGGRVELITADLVLADWGRLDERGHMFMRVAGPFAQMALALGGWLVFRTQVGRPGAVALVAWLFFAVNAWMTALDLVASPSIGFGDWIVVLQDMKSGGLLRVSASVTGLFVTGLLVKGTTETLAQLVGNGVAKVRMARARRVVVTTWAAGTAVAVLGALHSQYGVAMGVLIALGSTLIGTCPPLFLARRVGDRPVPGSPLVLPRSNIVVGLGAAAVLLMVFVFGPGVRL